MFFPSSRPAPAALLLVFAAALAFAPLRVHAQTDDLPTVTRTYALENARIVQAPGRVIERGTVVLRNGLITAVGTDVAVPFDAERIAADSMVVYAGFIDGLSHAGIPKPKEDAMLDPGDRSVRDLRKAGFGAAHTVPHGRMLPGSGAVVLLSGDAPGAMVLRDDVSLFAQFKAAPSVYPATPMGMTAKMRQLYREAERRHMIEKMYEENPKGLERPPHDAVHEAFFPVLEGRKPVFFFVESALEAYRALRLQKDLGFPLALGGLEQSFDLIDALKGARAPLFFTLALPKEPKKKTAAQKDSVEAAMAAQYDPSIRTATYRDLEAERRNLEARRRMSREKYLKNAAMLHEAGLRFGFSAMDVKPADIHANLREMIAHGLPEDAALAALTTDAADLLGLSAMLGSVDEGKIANLVVTTAPYFEEKAKIRYVFVDGVKYEYEVKEKKAPAGGEAVNPAGVWSYVISTPMGEFEGTLTLEGSPDNLRGTLTSSQSPNPAELQNVILEGNELSFTIVMPEGPGTLTFTLTLTGEDFEGSVNVPGMGNAPVTGTRESGPDRS